jgi:predicted Rossmann-fold nucleotide-binding protein
VLTWAQIGIHSKPVAVLNGSGFFDPLLALADHMTAAGFLRPPHRRLLLTAGSVPGLFDVLDAYEPPAGQPKWATPEQR